VLDAIVDSDRIAFDVEAGGEHYSVNLTPAFGSMWKGKWSCRESGQRGHVDARLYTCESDDGVVLVGNWKQDGDLWWFIELRP
jgi:hypothetical protein